ncbi:MAG: T9SS type A sorting domain-containing protein [Chitinophagales bacterium]|nr:T9SS type A sorting domain-containing protein [Chitinophagales bacterium]
MKFLTLLSILLTGTFSFVSVQHLRAQQCVLPAPETVTLDYVMHNAAALSWAAVDGHSGYSTKLRDLTDGSSHYTTSSFNSLVYDASVIQSEHEYEFIVSAKCEAMSEGANSEPLRFKARGFIIIIDIVDRFELPQEEVKPAKLECSLSPTQAETYVQLNAKVPPTETLQYTIVDLGGSLVCANDVEGYSGGSANVQVYVPVQDLKPGMYFMTLRTNTELKVQKFIKL